MTTINTGKCELVFVPDNNLSDFNDLEKGDVIPTAGFEYEFIGFTDELTEGDCADLIAYFVNAKESLKMELQKHNITGRQIVLRKKY